MRIWLSMGLVATALLCAGCPERHCPEEFTDEECEILATQGEQCPDGEVRCVADNTLERCDRGLRWEATPCGAEAVCTEGACGDDGCTEDRCVPIICGPGETQCESTRYVEGCNADGTAWERVDDCGEGTESTCVGGQCQSTCDLDDKSYIGCEYWAVDLDNAYVPSGGNEFYDAARSQFAVVVSNPDRLATARVEVRTADEQLDVLFVPPGGISVLKLPYDQEWVDANGIAESELPARRDVDGTVQRPLAYRINASVPVAMYQFNPLQNEGVFSNDASLLLPTHSLGLDYMIMTREQSFDILRGYLTVAATQPGATEVTVTIGPHARTAGGLGIEPMRPGETRTFTLQQFDVLSLQTDAIGADLTGSRVRADKKVAVFGGSEAANAPNTSRCDLETHTCEWDPSASCACDPGTSCNPHALCSMYITCCADHLEEQLFPVEAWGIHYVVARSFPRGSELDVWRVLALEDDTRVDTLPPQTDEDRLEHAGDWLEFESGEDFEIRTDKPVLVGQFLAAQDAPDPNVTNAQPGDAGTGDPAFILAVPAEQFRESYVFLAPPSDEDGGDAYAFD